MTFVSRLDQLEDGSTIQDALDDKTGQRTVPNIFVSKYLMPSSWRFFAYSYLRTSEKQHIGGNDDTQAAHRAGKLKELLAV